MNIVTKLNVISEIMTRNTDRERHYIECQFLAKHLPRRYTAIKRAKPKPGKEALYEVIVARYAEEIASAQSK